MAFPLSEPEKTRETQKEEVRRRLVLKRMVLAGSLIVAVPAFAQDMNGPAASTETPSQEEGGVAESSVATAAAPATTAEEVSTIVNAEFATYDRNGNGTLEKEEFAAWMDALKARAPAGGDRPGDAKWNDAAFAQADKDKSASLTRDELTGFLGSTAKSSGG